MKCWIEKGNRCHIVCDLDEATEISLALGHRARINVLKAPGIEEMAERVAKAAAHMLSRHDATPHKPESDSQPLPEQPGTLPGK